MAHYVKCRICGERFDTEKEPTFKKSNWYAHQKCYDEREAAKSQDEKDLDHLMEYCSRLYGRLFNYNQTLRLAKSYHEKNGFSFSGIERTMKYVYEIKKEPIEKGNGSIGIVPYMYDKAYNYWYSIWEANHAVKPHILEKYEPKVIHIKIPVPERKEMIRKKPYNFLDLKRRMMMASKYVDVTAIVQVIGSVFIKPSILEETDKYTITPEDFVSDFHKVVFGAIQKTYELGAKNLTVENIYDFLSSKPKSLAIFETNKGEEWLKSVAEKAIPSAFDFYYNKMKKMTLLRAYDSYGVDVDFIYNPNEIDTKKLQLQEEQLD